MNIKKNLIRVILSNLVTLSCGLLISLFLPIYISVEDYGLYQRFCLYSGYLGIFMFGFNDGVNLMLSKFNQENVDKSLVRSFIKFALIWLISFSLIPIIVSFFIKSRTDRIILFAIGLNIFLFNFNGLFLHINQATERFKNYSIANTIPKVMFCLISILAILVNKTVFYIFIACDLISQIILLIYNLATSRRFVFGNKYSFKLIKDSINSCFNKGFFVMISALISIFMTTYPKLLVDFYFQIDIFSSFAFANSLLSLGLQILVSLGVVIFPIMRKMDNETFNKTEKLVEDSINYIGMIGLIFYYVIIIVVQNYIYKYSFITEFLYIIFPIFIFQSKNSILTFNYFKIREKEKTMFLFNASFLVINFLITFLTFLINKNFIMIPIVSTILYILYSEIMYIYIKFDSKIKIKLANFMDVFVSAFFIVTNYFLNFQYSFLLFSIFSLLLLVINYKKVFNIIRNFI